ncbi:MAG: hypothetical protein K6C05_09980 [Anaerovibrio sp.]|uniref:hypothetical protein n=1 Tax=Anaerovibrio sp. TaxID=1872532 RepID=UPI0025D59F1E|nr:hypothetical protein [Anaerovibrio sp.]MCR5177162.1 hypothetical protein [Anaerovibrio sp.]
MTKLNESKKLSINEMDNVAGGNYGGTATDSQFLNDMGLAENRYGGFKTMLYWGEISSMVDKAWAKGGITCVTKPTSYLENRYYIGATGQEVSQEEAMAYVGKKLGKSINWRSYGYGFNPMWDA